MCSMQPASRRPQRGIALAVVLVVMTIITLLGLLLLSQSDTNLLMAGNEREGAICRQAAEAATREGIALASTQYTSTNRYSVLLPCPAGITTCPPATVPAGKGSPLDTRYIVDSPGNPFAAAPSAASPDPNNTANWYNRRFSGSGPGDRSTIYVSIYARNNVGDGGGVLTDKDSRVVIVGEAVMTTDGSVPDVNRTNTRVRKIIAADILVPGATTGASHSGGNTGTTY